MPDTLSTPSHLFAGSLSGISQVLTGQPFDTLKVRLQTNPQVYKTTIQALKLTIQQEGISALYKGTMAPLAGVAAMVSIQFATLEYAKLHTPLFVAGAIAGAANTLISCPVELVRTRAQLAIPIGDKPSPTTWNIAQSIWRTEGLRGMFRGEIPTLWRDSMGYGCYFWTYEKLKQRLNSDSMSSVLISGSAAGYTFWLTVFPIDVIKSKLQASSNIGHNMLSTARTIMRTEGVLGFYRGITPCLLRSAPANAATFLTYEYIQKLLR